MKRYKTKIFPLLLGAALLSVIFFPSALALANETAPGRLTDLEQVDHREAVTLMVDLGVIDGKVDGSFDPKGTVDRATMAKMLCGILMGGTNVELFSGVDTGLTDIAGNWAENYIKYCSSVGIISGKGDGTFDPNGVVNVASAAKMLLVTLGYDALERGYASNPLWADNIMDDAEKAGLLDGISQYSFEPLTRDNAAQMVYNTLFAYTYTPEYGLRNGDKAIVGYTENPTTLGLETQGLVRYTAKIGSITGSAPPEVSYVSLFPKSDGVSDKAGILGQIRTGSAPFSVGPELADCTVVFYVKADWALTSSREAIELLTLKDFCSTTLTVLPSEQS